MPKYRPEMIKVGMQLGYPDETGNNTCDGEPILHFIVLCSEDEDRDALVIYDDDVQNFKDVSCCYYHGTLKGKPSEIENKLVTVVTEWLTDRTLLSLESCLEMTSVMVDRYRDLKDRNETVLYFNRLGLSYFSNKQGLKEKLLETLDMFLGDISNSESMHRLKYKLSSILRENNEEVFPIIDVNKCKVLIDFKVRDRDIKFEDHNRN